MGAEQRAEAVCLSEATVRNPGYAATWHALALDLKQSGQGAESLALLAAAPDDNQALGGLQQVLALRVAHRAGWPG